MKIGIDIRLIGKKRTGDETVFFNLVKNLAALDVENEYVLFTDRDPGENQELKAEIKKLNLKSNFKIVFIDSPNRFWWNLWALPNYLRRNPVDVFHTQYIAPFWLPKNVKMVLTIHDISFNSFPQFIKFSDLFFLKALIPRSLRMASKIIAVSEFTKNEIEKYYRIPAEKIFVALNGVDFEIFHRDIDPQKLERIRNKYNLPEKFILYIGTLQPRKNIPVLIEAMKILHEKHNFQNIKLVIAGNRRARNFDPTIDEAIKKHGLQDTIVFPGWIDEEDKAALYKLASCFVFPSLYEGFGIPIIEAMAAGTPVVSSDKSSLPEAGRDGALFADPEHPEEFAEKIRQILSDDNLRKNLVEKGKEVAKNFTWQKTAEKTLKIYASLRQLSE